MSQVLLKPPVDQEFEWMPFDDTSFGVPECAVRTNTNSSLIVGALTNYSGAVSNYQLPKIISKLT